MATRRHQCHSSSVFLYRTTKGPAVCLLPLALPVSPVSCPRLVRASLSSPVLTVVVVGSSMGPGVFSQLLHLPPAMRVSPIYACLTKNPRSQTSGHLLGRADGGLSVVLLVKLQGVHFDPWQLIKEAGVGNGVNSVAAELLHVQVALLHAAKAEGFNILDAKEGGHRVGFQSLTQQGKPKVNSRSSQGGGASLISFLFSCCNCWLAALASVTVVWAFSSAPSVAV